MNATIKSIRKIGLITAGIALLLVGFIMLFLPGPGVFLMIAGLSLLAREFRWAERALGRLKMIAAGVGNAVRRAFAHKAA